ncbi:UBP-type zinc finger domain-containing protein [Streptomyces polyrhachis]|uniref:UBP-type zinc finger domain-containing protein n=1 Tax=Streptomyces polyrhachis TaxID=1282885 RepID=A0ABW2GFF0_9ACTN
MAFGQRTSQVMPAVSPNGSAPLCEHLDGLRPAPPRSDGCDECRRQGADWVALLVCLTCGWVACSDDSPNQHAKAHYEETDHPLVRALEPGARTRWCYVHQRAV